MLDKLDRGAFVGICVRSHYQRKRFLLCVFESQYRWISFLTALDIF